MLPIRREARIAREAVDAVLFSIAFLRAGPSASLWFPPFYERPPEGFLQSGKSPTNREGRWKTVSLPSIAPVSCVLLLL